MNSYFDVMTLVQAPLTDGGWGGQRVRDWANATKRQVSCSVQAQDSREETSGKQVIVTGKLVHCGPAEGVSEVDRVEYRGVTYEVTGVEQAMMQGRPDHLVFTMEVMTEPST